MCQVGSQMGRQVSLPAVQFAGGGTGGGTGGLGPQLAPPTAPQAAGVRQTML